MRASYHYRCYCYYYNQAGADCSEGYCSSSCQNYPHAESTVLTGEAIHDYMSYGLKLLVSPLRSPIVVPYKDPYITPLRSLDYCSHSLVTSPARLQALFWTPCFFKRLGCMVFGIWSLDIAMPCCHALSACAEKQGTSAFLQVRVRKL